MRARDREYLNEESGRRLVAMFQRIAQVRQLAPWLPPHTSHAELRRTVARLRAGVVRSIDPRIPAGALADLIEASIAQDLFVKQTVAEMHEFKAMRRAIKEKDEGERRRSFVAGFHRLKRSPEASDSESPVAERVRRIHRARREEHGRPRRRPSGRRKRK